MFSVSPEIYQVLSLASRWLFAFFALMLLLFALSWHHADKKERRDRFQQLPGAGTVGELVVLSGSEDLPPDTWFPVPREGVLGSLRSCDLVVPCPGVSSQHLDFSWQDGAGLLIRPRAGCEVLVDGTPVSRRGAWADAPLIHGSLLQVGSAVLRLQLFSALSHTSRVFAPQAPVPQAGGWFPPSQIPGIPGSLPGTGMPPASVPFPPPVQGQPPVPSAVPDPQPQVPAAPEYPPELPAADPSEALPESQSFPQASPQPRRRRRSDSWKEDWSE